jgi:hypothetical protein
MMPMRSSMKQSTNCAGTISVRLSTTSLRGNTAALAEKHDDEEYNRGIEEVMDVNEVEKV